MKAGYIGVSTQEHNTARKDILLKEYETQNRKN